MSHTGTFQIKPLYDAVYSLCQRLDRWQIGELIVDGDDECAKCDRVIVPGATPGQAACEAAAWAAYLELCPLCLDDQCKRELCAIYRATAAACYQTA